MHPCEELWISRAIDRKATAEDWRALATVAASDHDVWRRLCTTLREESLLGAQLSARLPAAAPPPLAAPRRRRVGSWFGLAAAALIGLCGGRLSAPGPAAAPAADAGDPGTPDALLNAYVDAGTRSGRVLEPLPLQTLATRRLPNENGIEVVFVRSFVECARVDHAMTLAADEHGRPSPHRVDLAKFLPPTNY